GFLTCVLSHSWLDDGPGRLLRAQLLQLLRRRFHLVLESCRLGSSKPQLDIFSHLLQELRVQPQEV
ncbi:HYES hydrolase, partial [Rhadina sibilatrix]|nr:HYES hydrolase [Rhadina sibilatrix]